MAPRWSAGARAGENAVIGIVYIGTISAPSTAAADPPDARGRPADDPAGADPLRVWFRFIRLHRRVSAAVAAELKVESASNCGIERPTAFSSAATAAETRRCRRMKRNHPGDRRPRWMAPRWFRCKLSR
jgi:hypothetical protein